MTAEATLERGDVFIVDNSDDDWKVREFLREWTEFARAVDIATGYFEIGGLLALEGDWQKLEKIRILMGEEVSKRTKQELLKGINAKLETLNHSLERQKLKDDFLGGVPGIVDALKRGAN